MRSRYRRRGRTHHGHRDGPGRRNVQAPQIEAVTRVLLTKLVVRGAPFHCTAAPDTKLFPLTVSVNPGPPAVALFSTQGRQRGHRVCRLRKTDLRHGITRVLVIFHADDVDPRRQSAGRRYVVAD